MMKENRNMRMSNTDPDIHGRSKEHTEYLEKLMKDEGVPYCYECHDWHFIGEEHSMMPDKGGE